VKDYFLKRGKVGRDFHANPFYPAISPALPSLPTGGPPAAPRKGGKPLLRRIRLSVPWTNFPRDGSRLTWLQRGPGGGSSCPWIRAKGTLISAFSGLRVRHGDEHFGEKIKNARLPMESVAPRNLPTRAELTASSRLGGRWAAFDGFLQCLAKDSSGQIRPSGRLNSVNLAI